MKKRMTSLLLVLAMCFAMLPTAAFAAENTQEPTEPQEPQETQDAKTWGDKADTSWYVHETESEYHIKTAEQLAGIAKLVNEGTVTFEGKTVYLDNDLDLAGIEWISIGTGRGGLNDDKPYCFCGTFDGQGHVISNLYSRDSLLVANEDNERNLYRTGLFGNVNGGEIRNLGVLDADVSIDSNDVSAAGEAILVDFLVNGKITNCWTTGRIASGSYLEKNIGGIVGVTLRKCTISGCYSTATLTGNFANSGGYYNPNLYLPPETIGGIVGTRFDGNLTVTDCWFGGKIVVNSILAAVGGIVGYTDDQLGSGTVNNCMVTTTDMGVDNDGNTCWVAYALGGTVENCYWPNDTKYGPSPLAHGEGTAVTDFTSADVLTGLNTNAAEGVEWVAGIKHPTFEWDKWHISADYSAVDAAIAKANAIDSNLYSNYANVEKAIGKVDRSKSKAEQTEVDAMAKAIEDAIAALKYKDADYTKVDAAIAKANALNKNDYRDFSAVKAALDAVARDKNITEQAKVDAMAKAIEDAINALVRKSSGGGSSSPSYSVTIPNKTENGTVTVSPRSAEKGDTVTITAKPDSGYQLDDLTVTDKNGKKLKLTDKGNGKYTFTMPASKVTVTPTFVKIAQQPTGKTFVDVAKSDWFADAVAYVTEKGLMNGTGSDTFSPNASTTRGMLMTVLARYAGEDTTGGSPWYQKGMNWAKAKG
uniref:InlB B-repeat-containing protein n=1 Tax=Agathobaculum sp. TaxID=2048138 RepID=UPI003AB752EB